jgi:hypothetical protein
MPGGCTPSRARSGNDRRRETDGSLRLGYFGSLADHAGVRPLVETVLTTEVLASLEICGYGKFDSKLGALAAESGRIKFHGLLTPDSCLSFGRSCDVLVNPRPASYGNENNFSSKLFDYALAGRAILTSNLSGVEDVLGPDAFYFNAEDFHHSLRQSLHELSTLGRTELERRGAAVQQRVTSQFSWTSQGARLVAFLSQVCIAQSNRQDRAEAMAA